MVATLCLISAALTPAQPVNGSEWLLVPRLNRGQEFVYQGTYQEETLGKSVQFTRTYAIQHRVFVLEKTPQGSELALLTTLRQRREPAGRPPSDEAATSSEPNSVRLELARCNAQGRLSPGTGTVLLVPLSGPATVECGALIEVPNRRLGVEQRWETAEEGRPPHAWVVAGTESISGTTCVKLSGVQQSDDWDHPRADRTAWRRRDLVWLSPQLGIAVRVERTIEQREPLRAESTSRTVTRYELENTPIVYPNQLFEDRHREIMQARTFAAAAEPLLRDPGKFRSNTFEATLTRIHNHLNNHAPTPYREAVLQVERRLDAARSQPTTPVAVIEPTPRPTVAAVGQPAPDFVVPGLTTPQPVRLRSLLGKPVLLFFYSPTSITAVDLLRFAQSMQDKSNRITVVGLVVSDDDQAVLKQHKDLNLHIPVISGKGMRQSYAVEATPKVLVLDGEGIVRAAFEGWGREIPQAVSRELERWEKKP
jgi:peroxiredoxin